MPKDAGRRDLTPAELEQEQKEKFKTFFTTSVAEVPDELIPQREQPDRKHGLLARFFAKKEKARGGPPLNEEPEEIFRAETPIIPTGEIMLDGSAPPPRADESLTLAPTLEELTLELEGQPEAPPPEVPAEPPAEPPARTEADAQPELSLELEPIDPPEAAPAAPNAAPPAEPQPEPQPQPEPKPKPQPKPQPKAVAQPRRKKPRKKPVRVPDEEDKELEKLKVILDTMGPQPARPAPPPPEEDKEVTEQVSGFHFFGIGEDEAPRGQRHDTAPEDTMSLELHEDEPLDEAAPPPPKAAAPAARKTAKKPKAEPPRPDDAPAADEAAGTAAALAQTPEEAAQAMTNTVAALNLRCALSGILAAALLGVGFIYEGMLPALGGLTPAASPAAFMGVNLLLLAAALAVSRGLLVEGLRGLVQAPTYATMPALAAAAALLQAAAALLDPAGYQSAALTLMSGAAAFALFLANLGDRLLAVSVRDGHKLATSGVEHLGSYRARDKDLIRCLAPALEGQDPWLLLSRPVEGDGSFMAQSLSPRAGEKKAQTAARALLGCAVIGAFLMLLAGRGLTGAVSALAAVLCLGAPLSATLIAGLTALRAERTAGSVGAVIPGWAGIQELNGIDTIQVDAGDLFTPESAQLEDIRIFKGGRIDRAILYTASVLNQGCNTLSRLFRTIIADRTDILPPVKDLERHTGLGFSAWCDNNRILIGTRAYMEQEGVALPEASYEARHSQDGQLQILYLAVAGNMYAMFVLRYIGGKHAARCLSILQKENIRLMVTCQDPSLTAEKIAAAYHLPDGLVTVLDEAQCKALAPAVSAVGNAPCCMLHLKGFTSLTGGLRAAQRAQAAESAGVAIQMVSTGFSALIGLLLSYSGSVGTLSLLVVLMYQAAWSALGMVAAAMKQHN